MTPIEVNDFLDIPSFKEEWPEFKAVDKCDREKISPDMEVLVRRSGEDIVIRIESVNDQVLVGKVLTKKFYFEQPFQTGDFVQFFKKNVINIYDIERTGVLY